MAYERFYCEGLTANWTFPIPDKVYKSYFSNNLNVLDWIGE